MIPIGPELIVIVGVLVLLFGASRIPEVARSLGEATGEFGAGREDIEEQLDAETEVDR